jgi:hypothetical protein
MAYLWHARGRFQNSCVPRRAPILTLCSAGITPHSSSKKDPKDYSSRQTFSFCAQLSLVLYNQKPVPSASTEAGKRVDHPEANMNRINIDHLTEAELIDLNHRIVQRLRLMSQVNAHKAMLEFRIGDRVTFEPEGGTPVFGILTRYNKKSVTVITDDGHRWNVSPRFLRLAESTLEAAKTQEGAYPPVIPFRQK